MKSFSFMVFVLVGLSGCQGEKAEPQGGISILLQVVDEDGASVSNATVAFLGRAQTCDKKGRARLVLSRPSVLRISAPGFLEEVALLGWASGQTTQSVRLLRDLGGRRVVLHLGGDVMFGRRFLDPSEGEPLLEVGAEAQGARLVVSDLAEAFTASDLGIVNLETVVSRLADTLAYPGKRYLLRSPPEALEALPFMGVDVVTLANNHLRDWLDAGIEDTLFAVEAAGLRAVGAGMTQEQANEPLELRIGELTLGILGYTSLTGNSVNDALPGPGDTPPADLADDRTWMYEARSFGIELDDWSVPVDDRRPGEAWTLYKDAESSLSQESRSTAWTALSEVYPELQDLVARRGHGGAALWSNASSPAAVRALADKCDATIVLLHSGDELSHIVADDVRTIAYAAIDAGATLVVAHHPHVLQGMEWYRGGLIAHSLGNLVFDQALLATFDSAMLRVVLEDGKILEARFIPLTISNFRPLPLTDAAAARVWLRQMESSMDGWRSYRDPVTDKVVPLSPTAGPPSTGLWQEWGTARVLKEPRVEDRQLSIPAGQTTALAERALWPTHLGLEPWELEGVWLGRDLLGYGTFDNVVATDTPPRALHWNLDSEDEKLLVEQGQTYLELYRDDRNESSVMSRPVARMELPRHRLYGLKEPQGVEPLDPLPSYSLMITGRATEGEQARVRLDFSDFDSTDLTASAGSVSLGRVELPLSALGPTWTTIEVPIELPAEHRDAINMVMLYFVLERPSQGEATLDLAEVALVEWRPAAEMPNIYGAFTHVRSERDLSVSVQVLPIAEQSRESL
ncbi:MAG: CapA family protein [Myxococcota bacterium]|jgi:poly-gamma-glutamate capsule biosynthesis protein CapA/YwtB (metallophosphatase superfamily)|nr:CapA family protein [Myxococcota bacterium]